MRMPPVSVLSAWPTPNYIDPVTKGPENVVMVAIFFPLALFIVGIRMYTRIRLSKSFGLDDWFILAAVLPTAAFAGLSLVAEIYFKWNRHIWDVRLDTIVSGLKVVVATEILFCLASSLTKISMLLLTYRLVGNSSRLLSKIIIGTIALVSTQGTAFILAVLFQCGKPSTYWTLSFAPQPECISETKLLLAAGIVNVVTDLFTVLLPIPTVWRVKLPVQQQIVLVLLFSTGFAVTLVGAIRTYYLYRVTSDWDKTWEAYPVWVTSSVELYVGLICASIPATGRFFSQFGLTWLSALPHPTTSFGQSGQLSSPRASRMRHDMESGIIQLGEYNDDKKIAQTYDVSKAEGTDAEYTCDMELERPQTAYSKSSGCVVTRMDSMDLLVVKEE